MQMQQPDQTTQLLKIPIRIIMNPQTNFPPLKIHSRNSPNSNIHSRCNSQATSQCFRTLTSSSIARRYAVYPPLALPGSRSSTPSSLSGSLLSSASGSSWLMLSRDESPTALIHPGARPDSLASWRALKWRSIRRLNWFHSRMYVFISASYRSHAGRGSTS